MNTRQIMRVQSVSYDFNAKRENVLQLGTLAPIDQVILTAPTVNLNFNYILTNAWNESGLGLVSNGSSSIISSINDGTQDDKNYFVQIAPYGDDAAAYTGIDSFVVGFGNGFLSSYSVEAAVGAFPTASCKVEALNIAVYSGTSGQFVPAINPTDGSDITGFTFVLPEAQSGLAGQVSALRPGDITLSLGTLPFGVLLSDAKIQRFTLGVELAREEQNKLGSKFPVSRLVRFPLTATLSIEAQVGDLTTGSLSTLFCNDQDYNLTVTLNQPACPGVTGAVAAQYTLMGAKMDGQNFNTTIGPNETVTVNWTALIGSAQQTGVGLFLSGAQL